MSSGQGAPGFGDKERECKRQADFSKSMLKGALKKSKACQTMDTKNTKDTKDTKDTSVNSHAFQTPNTSHAFQTPNTSHAFQTPNTSHAFQMFKNDDEFKYLIEAAKSEDCAAMIKVARAFNTGVGLPPSRQINWVKAVYWLEKAVSAKSEDEGDFNSPLDDPSYQLVAEEAMMYLNGGYGLAKDAKKAGELFNWAAELATGARKDNVASKYYMQAKEAWQCVNQRGKKKRN